MATAVDTCLRWKFGKRPVYAMCAWRLAALHFPRHFEEVACRLNIFQIECTNGSAGKPSDRPRPITCLIFIKLQRLAAILPSRRNFVSWAVMPSLTPHSSTAFVFHEMRAVLTASNLPWNHPARP